MRSQYWDHDQMEKEFDSSTPDFKPSRRGRDVYITGVDEFAGLFVDFENGKATKAYLLKDISN